MTFDKFTGVNKVNYCKDKPQQIKVKEKFVKLLKFYLVFPIVVRNYL